MPRLQQANVCPQFKVLRGIHEMIELDTMRYCSTCSPIKLKDDMHDRCGEKYAFVNR